MASLRITDARISCEAVVASGKTRRDSLPRRKGGFRRQNADLPSGCSGSDYLSVLTPKWLYNVLSFQIDGNTVVVVDDRQKSSIQSAFQWIWAMRPLIRSLKWAL